MFNDFEINGHNEDKELVSFIGNTIYFYSDITPYSVLELNKALKIIDDTNIQNQIERSLKEPNPIYIHINSRGGYSVDGFAAMDNISDCKSKTISIVEGIAASAATFLSLVADERWMRRSSFMMIHQLTKGFYGTYSEMEDSKENAALLMRSIKDLYKRTTKLPMKKLDEMLKHDLYFDAETCLKYSMVDKIM